MMHFHALQCRQIFVAILFSSFCFTSLSSTSAPDTYLNVPIYLDHNITINHNLNFLSARNESHNGTTISLSSLHMQHYGTQKSFAQPPHFVADLAKQLDEQLRWIRDHEMEIPTIQRLFDAVGRSKTAMRNDTKLLVQFANKLQRKIDNAVSVVNETSTQILNLFHAYVEKLDFLSTTSKIERTTNEDGDPAIYLETMVLPCDSYEDGGINDAVLHELVATDDNSGIKQLKRKPVDLLNFLSQTGHPLHEHEDLNYTLNSQLLEMMKAIDLDVPNFKNAYFLSKDNFGGDSNCRDHYSNQQFRYLFSSAIKSKNVMLIIDHGASVANEEQYDLTKSFALDIINLLNENDRLTIVGVANKVLSFNSFYAEQIDTTEKNQMYAATADNKRFFIKFLDTLNKTKEITNHTLAFEYSFDLLERIYNVDAERLDKDGGEAQSVLILYVSRGLLSQMTEAKIVLETIAAGQIRLPKPVIINTCAIIIDEKRVMYEKQFLNDVATQNYTKYNIGLDTIHAKYPLLKMKMRDNWLESLALHSKNGRLFVVNKRFSNEIIQTATAALTRVWFRKEFFERELRMHLPIYDHVAKDSVIAVTKASGDLGLFGVNLYLSDLIEDIIFYQNRYDDSYAFLIDNNGIAIWHPSYPRPQTMQDDYLFPTNILYLEKVEESVRRQWLNLKIGKVTVITQKSDHYELVKTYTWQHVSDLYIIFIVTVLNVPSKTSKLQHNHQAPSAMAMHHSYHNATGQDIMFSDDLVADLMFHRLDLILPTPLLAGQSPKLCDYFKRLSVQESGTLFLSAAAFKSPFRYLKTMCDVTITEVNSYKNHQEVEECVNKIRSIMAYIKDNTKLLTNPGLQQEVRSDVLLLSHAVNVLRRRHLQVDVNTDLSKYIIRRYVSTSSGALQMYPGCVLETNFEPSCRPWFMKAMEHPGKIVVTEPYLDAGGAGYIVTISHTITENTDSTHSDSYRSFHRRRRRRHSSSTPKVVAVVSVDITRGYFYKLLVQSSLYCQDDANIKCFLIEDNGYLIVHPSILDPAMPITSVPTTNRAGWSTRRPAVIEHITHKESLVSNDMLLHKNLVEKRMCQNLLNRRIERFYKFNTSLTEVLTNVVNGERSKYQITSVPTTNVFVVMVNSTEAEGGTAFCPCSTVDRICFNCNRMESITCECPCECPILSMDKGVEINDYTFNDSENSDKHVDLVKNIEICRPPPEQVNVRKIETAENVNLDLQSCVNVSCEQYTSQFDCLGIIGCEWCQVDVDGESSLLAPFCTNQLSCFNGVLGSLTPYGEGDLAVAIDSMLPSTYTTLGPVVGAVLILCLVIVLAMYCYRQNIDPGSEQLYIESIPADHNVGLPLARFDYDTLNPNNGTGSDVDMHNAIILPSDISPYRMPAGNYRRPNGESDHGYSTMTPHEDSDHVCFTLIEPLISNRKSNMSISDATSINVDSSSPPSHKNSRIKDGYEYCENGMTTTLISSPHHIQAPVTVHQPMEAA